MALQRMSALLVGISSSIFSFLVLMSGELTAIYVPGRKTIVRKAIPFIAELSRLEATAISRESAASTVEYSESF